MGLEAPKFQLLRDFFVQMENELEPYENRDIDFQKLHTVRNTAAGMVIKLLKKMLKPEALDSVQLSDEQLEIVKDSFLDAVEIGDAGYGHYRVVRINRYAILAIAAYLNGMIPPRPESASLLLGQLDLWPRVADTIKTNR